MSNYKGFTLIQLLIVIALSSIIVGMSLPFVALFDRLSIHMELDRLYQLCMLLQQRAQLEGREYTITFDTKKQEYFTDNNQHYRLSKALIFGVLPMIKGPPSLPTNYLKKAVTFPNDQIVFYPSGIVNPGAVYFIDRYKRALYALTVSVSPISYIRRYTYDEGWKLLK